LAACHFILPVKEAFSMAYKVYSGPPGTETIPPMEKDRWLFKEFGDLDEAIGWARHLGGSGRVALLIEGDDGTRLTKHQIAAVLHHEPGPDGKTAYH
jgi:hypothetical protein